MLKFDVEYGAPSLLRWLNPNEQLRSVNARHRFRIKFCKNQYVKRMTAKRACNILLFFVFAHAKTQHAHHWRAYILHGDYS